MDYRPGLDPDRSFGWIIILHKRCLWQIWSLVTATSVYKHYKLRCAAILIMIDFSTFVVSSLGMWKDALCCLSQCCEYQDEPNHLFSCFLWLCCVGLSSFTFLLYLEDYQDWPTVFRLSEEVVRKPELFFVSTLCVLSNVSHLHSEEEGNHLLGWDELF